MIIKWLVRLAFPALGVLLLLIVFGLEAPKQAATPMVKKAKPSDIPAFETLVPDSVAADTPNIIFKWQDIDGSWHYADQPPPQGPWNNLAIERPGETPKADWQTPYNAPFSMELKASES